MSLASASPIVSIKPSLANQDIGFPLTDKQRENMRRAAAKKIEELFDILMIDHRNDHNTCETPARVARMMVDETLRGRYEAPPKVTEFLNSNNYDQMIVTGPIGLRSTCAHHLMPIHGHAIIGIIPSPKGKIIGLSKYDRLAKASEKPVPPSSNCRFLITGYRWAAEAHLGVGTPSWIKRA